MMNVFLLSVANDPLMLSVIKLNVIKLNVIKLNVIKLNVIKLNVVMLFVVAPSAPHDNLKMRDLASVVILLVADCRTC